jgi:transcription elongation GreA/GreB family factor
VSVAFRRESDEEHKEPRFELPLPPGPNLVTQRGLAQIEDKVAELEARIAAGGDEAALAEAKRDLRYWQTRRATAELAPAPAGDEVAFGTRVRFRLDGAERTLAIVGDDESDPPNGYLGFSAPLAKAMLGACEGDLVDFAGRAEAIEVLEISALD